MRALHLDCFSGVSGNMMLAALLELGVPEEILRAALASLDLPGQLVITRVKRQGLAATHVAVEAPQESKHRHLSHIEKILDRGALTEGARALARRLFRRLGEAEAASHGVPIEKVHFHEVGAIDSIFDFVGIAVAVDWLKPERVTSSPVPTGHGWVDCEHGRMPVPPPAVARLLTGIPLAPSRVESELTTPTGAAVVATIVNTFCREPAMIVHNVGHGAGTKDFPEQPNLLRLFWGESLDAVPPPSSADATTDLVWQIDTHVDDVPGEHIGYCLERLFDAGALDAFTVGIQMKKNRPGVWIVVLADEARAAAIETVLFRETGTFGIRKRRVERSKLARREETVETPWGAVRGKLGWRDGVRLFSPEFEDCARVARAHNVPLRDVFEAARRRFSQPAETAP